MKFINQLKLMINTYPKKSIGYSVMQHNNDYGINLSSIFKKTFINLPTLSIVVPYYDSWNTVNKTLEYLIHATKGKSYEIIVVDDGSIKYPAEKIIIQNYKKNIKIVNLNKNMGRSFARNVGLNEAKNDVVAFMDSDILMPTNLIDKHLKLHAYFKNKGKGCITFSLFNNLSVNDWNSTENKNSLFDKSNDFRNECVYRSTWIGCEDDKKYIGNHYRIIDETDNLRRWPVGKSLGPWLLSNMVLGGFFTVNKSTAIEVGGFSKSFRNYGFTEIPLSTKIIARFDDYVIPVPSPYLLHLHNGGVSLSQHKRNEYFKEAHNLFFQVYLKQDLCETIKNEKI
jgi:glycosyltransferase involved in cell wall biosynthesis